MPTVFRRHGFRFYFYVNDHRPVHIHVSRGSGEAVFNVEGGVGLKNSSGFKTQELSLAERLIKEHRQLIMEVWHEYLG